MAMSVEKQSTYADRFVLVVMGAPEFHSSSTYCEGGVVHFIGEDAGLWTVEVTRQAMLMVQAV